MDRFDVLLAVEYWGGTLLVISAFAAPAVFPAIAMYVSRRSEQPLVREGSVAAGFVSGFLYALLALFFAACHGVYVGDPPRQQVGIAWAEPIIVSIDRYRAARGRLPDSLGSLVPEFVSDRAMLYLTRTRPLQRWPDLPRGLDGLLARLQVDRPGAKRLRVHFAKAPMELWRVFLSAAT